MSVKEKVEERKFVRLVKEYGGRCIKLGGAGPFNDTGDPDRMALGPYRTVVYFEFKRVGKKPTKLQSHVHKQYRKLEHVVHVVYFAKEAFKIYEEEVKFAKLRAKVLSRSSNQVRLEKTRRRVLPRSRSRKDRDHSAHL